MRTNRLVRVFTNVKGLRIIRVEMGVFNTWVRIAVGPKENIQAYIRWADRKPNWVFNDSDTGFQGMCIKTSGYAPVVWIPRRPRTPEEHATLAHECVHAAFYLMDWLGMEASQNTCEVMTHATGWLVKNALEHS